MKSVIILGTSGHAKVIADIIQKSGDKVIGFLDNNSNMPDGFIGYPILGTDDDYKKFVNQSEFIIAVGNADIREKINKRMYNVNWYTAIHPTAVISDIDVSIGKGTVIMANAVINPGTTVGKHCIINTGAVVEHDNVIEDYVHISVGAKLAGTVRVGKSTWIGIGATVCNNINICSGCMIGAGAGVIRNIENKGTYVGLPARMIEMRKITNIPMSNTVNTTGNLNESTNGGG